ncbi:hypothetical protein IW140_003744 [Coemansia sp. RSA 1813]|nr:hypothetical protein IW140_003744 [Coemansia sp. RSA 1813]
MKKYKYPGQYAATREIMIKYRDREKQLLQSGTWDMQWGLRWLLSFVVLIDAPVLSIPNANAMVSVVNKWLYALKKAKIQEVEEQFAELEHIISVATDELAASLSASGKLPGRFNAACSLIFAGELKEAFIDLHMPKWALADHVINTEEYRPTDAYSAADSGLSLAEARECVAQVFGSDDLSQVASMSFQPDIESLFADHVKNADIVADINRADASMRIRYEEEDFVLWGADDDAAPTEDKIETLPDCIFIDGIDKIASADR